jgi:hypothetical protein
VEGVATAAVKGPSVIVVVVVVVVRTDWIVRVARIGRIGGVSGVWIVGIVVPVNLEGYVGGCQYRTTIVLIVLSIIGGVVSVVVNGYGDLHSMSLD